jgi:beta-N-acetylhexosaminidase
MVMARMTGTTPDQELLVRIRDGEVGGVILYADDISSPSQVRALTEELQNAARAGGNPPLLISTDQEGGQVKRLPWAPPGLTPQQMGADGSSASRSQGELTGRGLREVGVNVDLAPVVDVAHSTSAFIYREGRSFGMSSQAVLGSAVPFASGLEQAGVAPTAKHFPGVGGAITDTDSALQTITSTPADVIPYRSLIADQVPIIMVSTGIYPDLDSSGVPAALSSTIVTGLLRDRLGYQGVVMSDDLERPSGTDTAEAAVRAARAGVDIILVSTTQGAGPVAYGAMLSAARSGAIPMAEIESSYARVVELKRRYAES